MDGGATDEGEDIASFFHFPVLFSVLNISMVTAEDKLVYIGFLLEVILLCYVKNK